MLKNINSYIKVYKKLLSVEYCQSVIEELELHNWENHEFYHPDWKDDKFKVYEDAFQVSNRPINSNDDLMKILWSTIDKYHKELNCTWYNTWSGYRTPRFNKYTINTSIRKHCDHIQSLFDGTRRGVPILSIVGLLNDDFKGGDFMINDEKIDLGAGDILMFPSSFLYPHEVLKITEGTRFSFVSWVW